MTAPLRFTALIAVMLSALVGCQGGPNMSVGPDRDGSVVGAGEQAGVEYVSGEWLQNRLGRGDLAILDSQPSAMDYIGEHIAGAVYLPEGLLRMYDSGIPTAYVPPGNVQAILRAAGVKPGQPVLLYSGKGEVSNSGGGLEQSMVAYSLHRFGVSKVYILDGGLTKWKAEHRPVVQQFPDVQKSSFTASLHDSQIVTMDQVRQWMGRPNVLLSDARTAAVYAGKGPWPKAGHIPGAVNLSWKDLMDPANPFQLKPKEVIRALAALQGITPDKTIIVYCGTGREATDEFLILKYDLGFPDVRIYEGSFTEWTAHPDNPTVAGPNPK